jgi:hypothetical protein
MTEAVPNGGSSTSRDGPSDRSIGRRTVLTRIVPFGALALAGACTSAMQTSSPKSPTALVYRGVAGCTDCSEPVAALLESSPIHFRVVFCGPGESVEISARSLSSADLYAQPGGGTTLEQAWRAMRPFAEDIRNWVRGGGHYLGICMGGYLAGFDPGFGLLPGDSGEYIKTAGATVHTDADAMVTVDWGGRRRDMYFQDGPYFTLRPGSGATVLARYSNGLVAALVARYGKGSVGVSGPHPEAPPSWYGESGLTNPDGVQFGLGYDLVETTIRT